MNTFLQDTIVNEEETIAENGNFENENTDLGENQNTSSNIGENTFLVAKYNKNDVPLTKEMAIELAQKGMHYEDKLDYLATIKGLSINEMLKKAIDDIDDAERSRLKEQFGDDADMIEKGMKIFHDDQREKYEKAIADRENGDEEQKKSLASKIGDEFILLKKDFPELKNVSDIPREVLKSAESMSLEHAYLKYLHNEFKLKKEALANQNRAKKQSTGSMQTASNADCGFESFAKGVWG